MKGSPKLLDWLSHRAGVRRVEAMPLPAFHFNLEGNRGTQAFLEHHGKRTIWGIVGFVDVVGFSTTVQGNSPEGIAAFLNPFLTGVCRIVTEHRGLVDKMIGDEIMFVVPELLEDGGEPASISTGQMLAELAALQRELGPSYRMRVGLAFGPLYVSHLAAETYSEWSIVGEPVHLAKRIMTLPESEPPDSIACAVGVLASDTQHSNFPNLLAYLASSAWDVRDLGTRDDLKGVSASRCAMLSPRDRVPRGDSGPGLPPEV